VPGYEDTWAFVGMSADHGAGFVSGEGPYFLEFVDENRADFVFEA
jgi:hypothetical protein